MLEQHGVRHFEEPCPYRRLDWTREVTETLDLDVAGGEQDWDEFVGQMIDTRVVDIVQPDVYTGGLTCAARRAHGGRGRPSARRTRRTTRSSSSSRSTCWRPSRNGGPYLEFSIEPDEDYPWQAGMYEHETRVAADGSTCPLGRVGGRDLAGLARAACSG